MISKLFIPISIKSKPRGQLGKYGNMTHSTKGYREWQNKFISLVKKSGFQPVDNVYSMMVQFHVSSSKKGRRNDLDNMCGSVLDSLTKHNIIKDDNWGILPRIYLSAEVSEKSSITIYFTQSKMEMDYVLVNYFN